MDASFARESVPLSGSAWGEGMTDQKARFWLAAATLGALLPSGAVLAADLPVKARSLAPAYYDWSGVYIGVHAGYGGGMTDWNDQGFDFAPRGFLGGGQVGINKQIASLVFGLELDGSWANFNRSQTVSIGSPAAGFQESFAVTSKIDGFLTLAGRAGLAADRWFVYAKGGLAFARDKHAFGVVVTQFPGVDSVAVSGSEDRWGVMVRYGICAGEQLVGQGRIQLHELRGQDAETYGHPDDGWRYNSLFFRHRNRTGRDPCGQGGRQLPL
jgi:outer membrane immunogenic protein